MAKSGTVILQEIQRVTGNLRLNVGVISNDLMKIELDKLKNLEEDLHIKYNSIRNTINEEL